jgi:enediyne core biosynthesis thioesterase
MADEPVHVIATPEIQDQLLFQSGNRDECMRAEDVVFKKIPPKKTYTCEFSVYLKDSNAYGNVYFARYFEWQGVVREKFWIECVCNTFTEIGIILATRSADIQYKKEVFPNQKITASLNVIDLKKTSAGLYIVFRNSVSNEIVSEGHQSIVFLDKVKKITRIPLDFYAILEAYQA